MYHDKEDNPETHVNYSSGLYSELVSQNLSDQRPVQQNN